MKIAVVPFCVLGIGFSALFAWGWVCFSAMVVAHGGEAISPLNMLLTSVLPGFILSFLIASLIEKRRQKRAKPGPA